MKSQLKRVLIKAIETIPLEFVETLLKIWGCALLLESSRENLENDLIPRPNRSLALARHGYTDSTTGMVRNTLHHGNTRMRVPAVCETF